MTSHHASRNLPAPIFDPWITHFEKEVYKKQQEINKLRDVEQMYNLTVDVLRTHKFPNQSSLTTSPEGIHLTIYLIDANHWRDFQPLADALARALADAHLRSEPFAGLPDTASDVYWRLHCTQEKRLTLHLDVPWGGTHYCQVTFEPYQSTARKCLWLDTPQRTKHTLRASCTPHILRTTLDGA